MPFLISRRIRINKGICGALLTSVPTPPADPKMDQAGEPYIKTTPGGVMYV